MLELIVAGTLKGSMLFEGFSENRSQMQKRYTTNFWCGCCQKTKRSNSKDSA